MPSTPTNDPGDLPRHATDPIGAISDIVLNVEPALHPEQVRQVVASVVKSRRGRRELASELQANPALLTAGHSQGPPSVERLVTALRAIGAGHLASPRCPGCGQARRLQVRRGDERICRPCSIAEQPPCTGCGHQRYVAVRDGLGRPYCQYCRPEQPEDPVAAICDVLGRVAPDFPREKAIAVVEQTIPHGFQRSRTAVVLSANPALLSGEGAQGTPRIIALIDALVTAGAVGIVAPRCPGCGSDALPLRYTVDGLRHCKRCYTDAKQKALCAGCQRHAAVAGRDLSGDALCNSCLRRDHSYHDVCSGCGQTRFLWHLGDRVCRQCFSRPTATCADCGQTKPCHGVPAGRPRCDACSARLRRQECARCSRVRRVYARGPQGEPLCSACGERKERCRDCGRTRPVWGRSVDTQALCRVCYAKDPVSTRECGACGQATRLFHHRLCHSCARQALAHDLLAAPDGHIQPDHEPLYQALLAGNPRPVLDWLQRSRTQALVTSLLSTNDPISHQTLDALEPNQAVRFLRTVLIGNGALPPRDEHLATFERELPHRLAAIAAPGERSIVKSFITWHRLRRLRRDSTTRPLTYGQLAAARAQLTAIVALLSWLRRRHLTLATCTQADIDAWLDQAAHPWHRRPARIFLLWAAKHRHCRLLEIAATREPGHHRTIDHDERWHSINHLLHSDDLDLAIRVAGLLLLLFGQPLSRIVRIATTDVRHVDNTVTIALGPEPVQLPPPLDALVLRLRNSPAGNHRVAADPRHWLFTGRTHPGRHLNSQYVAQRLKALGIRAQPGRNTALIELAAELPAAVLAKLLGLHPTTAVGWNARAGSPRAGYAAEPTRRKEFRKDR